jgi:hypothetical protein
VVVMSLVDQMVLAIGEHEFLLDLGTEELEDIARIALAAIRVPTEAMVLAAFRHRGTGDMVWQAMIDAALRE